MLAVSYFAQVGKEWGLGIHIISQLVSRFFPCCESTTEAGISWQRGQNSFYFLWSLCPWSNYLFILSVKLCAGNLDFCLYKSSIAIVNYFKSDLDSVI